MRSYTIHVYTLSGYECFQLEAKTTIEAVELVMKAMKSKEKRGIYRTITRIEVE